MVDNRKASLAVPSPAREVDEHNYFRDLCTVSLVLFGVVVFEEATFIPFCHMIHIHHI